MRTLELLALLSLLFVPLRLFLPQGKTPRWLDYVPVAGATFTLLHLFLEGARWQMVPAYVLIAGSLLLALRWWTRPGRPLLRSRGWRLVAGVGGVLLLAVAAALPAIFPVPDLPAPAGPYAVGTVTYHLVDESREEIYSDDPGDRREIMVQVWYPAGDVAGAPRAPYIDELDVAGPAVAQRLDLPRFLLDHVNLVQTHAFVEAPPATDGPFPALIFSHGLRGIRAQNTALMEEMASHGYVIASIDHTYGNVVTVFPDGRVVFYDDERVFPDDIDTVAAGRRLVGVWAADVGFVLDQMAVWNGEEGHLLSGRVDLERVGTLGHSTGGGTAIRVCGEDARCDAALALDGWIEPVPDAIVAEGLDKPALFMKTTEWLGEDNSTLGMALYDHMDAPAYLVTIAGAEHFDFSDLSMLSPLTPLLGLSGPIDSQRMLSIVEAYTLAFFEHTLRDEPAPLLDGPSPDYPEVTLETVTSDQ